MAYFEDMYPCTYFGKWSDRPIWRAVPGAAYSFWAALSLLALLGVRVPLLMLPLLLLHFAYQLIWLLAVGFPLMSAGKIHPFHNELFVLCFVGAVLDVIIIPWPYIFSRYGAAIVNRRAPRQGAGRFRRWTGSNSPPPRNQ
jgi:hypothetical protein